MGFMMENVNFRNLAKTAQDELLTRLPIFTPIETTEAFDQSADSADASSQRLARLLGAF
jgi:uncharacterized membrane protein